MSVRFLLSPLRRAAASAVDEGWTLGFRLGGRFAGIRARRLVPSGGQRILFVAPHPDDETAAAGGTLARHAAAGDSVTVAVVTDGRRSRAFGLAPDEMAARRQEEARNAARALGVEVRWLGLREGEWTDGEAIPLLADLLAAFSPDVLYAPSRVDFHPEHVRVAHSLAAALQGRAECVVRVYGVQVPLTSILVNVVSDVSDAASLATIHAAVDAYPTQAGSLSAAFRTRRHAAAFHGLELAAEEFWEMSPKSYRALHAGEPDPEPWRTFRGIRPRPFTDPLAHLVARRERARLRREARR